MRSSRSENPASPVSSKAHVLERIFRPGGVAIVGASRDPTKRGHQAIVALRDAGYQGRILPVNPKGGEILDLPVSATVDALGQQADLALICTPAPTVPGVLEQCAEAGIAGAVILALGFREIGSEGEVLEKKIAEVVQRTGIRVIGPNTSGILNPHIGLNLIGVSGVKPGRIALLSQSGNMSLAMMTEARRHSRQGFSLVVGVGNELDIRFDEYLEYLVEEPNTDVIAMYVEGFRRGQWFLEAASRVTLRKPVVLLKGGRSVRGKLAARSHTGAMAGSYPVFRAGMKKVGVIQVRRSDELFPVAETLATQPSFNGVRGVAVLTDGGGHGTLAVDALQTLGVGLAELSHLTADRVREALSLDGPAGNPVDLAGRSDSDPTVFARCLDALMQDDQVGGVLVVGLFGGYARRFSKSLLEREVQAAREMVEIARSNRCGLVVHSLYAHVESQPLDVLRDAGIPVVESLEVASRAMAACWQHGAFKGRRSGAPSPAKTVQWKGWEAVRQQERKVLLETEARELVSGHGIKVVPGRLAQTAEQAEEAVTALGGLAVFKVVSGVVSHKSDAGGVVLDVTASTARSAFERIDASVRAWCATKGRHPDIRGVLVTPKLPKPVAELIVGYKRDPNYGGVVIVGLGGIAVEVLKDVTLRLLPITRVDAREMLSEIKAARLLRGHRGQPAVDRDAVADAILAISDCARSNPEVMELEVNPLFAYEHGAVAVDVRAML